MTKQANSRQPIKALSRRSAFTTLVSGVSIVEFIAIVGLVLTLLTLSQDRAALVSGDVAQGTMISILDAQLGVQQAIATFQASNANVPQSTATAIAATISALVSTQTILEAERVSAQATLTALPQATSQPFFGIQQLFAAAPASPSTQPIATSQIEAVSVQLLEFSRFQNTITAKLRFVNTSAEEQSIALTIGSYLFNNVTQRRYFVVDQSNSSFTTTIPANDELEVWAKYPLPDEETPQFLDLALPSGVLFQQIEVKEATS